MDKQKLLLHVTRIPIRWGDMDAMGHVNTTVYFRYAEQARVEWFEGMGYGVNPRHATPVIINASCTFLVPLTYPDTVEVRMFAGPPGSSSLPTFYEMRRGGDERLCAEASAKVVWMDPATGRSAPLPEALRGLLEESGAPSTRVREP